MQIFVQKLLYKANKPLSDIKSKYSSLTRLQQIALFPSIVIFLLVAMTALGVSGSSIGRYHEILVGERNEDSALIAGEARSIRADEWQLITTKTIAQSENNFKSFNPNIGPNGEDVSVRPDIPTTDVNTIFRPQNWAFLFLPLDNAIAYKWWFFSAFVLITAYLFSLRFFSSSILIAIGLSMFLVYAPLPQWTYREFIFLVLGFGFMGILLADTLMRRAKEAGQALGVSRVKSTIETSMIVLLLAYCIVGYSLVLYPPTQIAAGIVLAAFYVDVVTRYKREMKYDWKRILTGQFRIATALMTAIALVIILAAAKAPVLNALYDTKHPGVRHFQSGHMTSDTGRLRNLVVGASTPLLLQKDSAVASTQFFTTTKTGNQSEASNYPWLAPLLILLIIFRFRIRSWPYATLAITLFILTWMLVPGLSLPLIEQVQPARWNLALGLATFLLLGILFRGERTKRLIKSNKIIIGAVTTVFTLVSLGGFIHLARSFPDMVGLIDVVIFIAAGIAIPLLLGMLRYRTAILLLAFVMLSVNINVNPLYQGTASATRNPLVNSIRKINDAKSGGWLMATNREVTESIPLLAGAHSITTHYAYPQKFWQSLDTSGAKEDVYNRTAHISVELADVVNPQITLKSVNTIHLKFSPCDVSTVSSLAADYVVTIGPYEGEARRCLKHISTINGGSISPFVIYEIAKEDAN